MFNLALAEHRGLWEKCKYPTVSPAQAINAFICLPCEVAWNDVRDVKSGIPGWEDTL